MPPASEDHRDLVLVASCDHLVVTPTARARIRPIHLASAALAIGSIATAGPTWQREQPPFVEDRAPLVIAVNLGPAGAATTLAGRVLLHSGAIAGDHVAESADALVLPARSVVVLDTTATAATAATAG